MLFQPAIIALLLVAGLGLLALAAAAPGALQMVRHWDLASGSRRQLGFERRTWLMSTLVRFVLFAQLAALLLFVLNAERMAPQFVGAMCAVGTLQANGWGFPALLAQLALFFAAAQWLLIDHADNQARDYPLLRIKYGLLLTLLLPLVGLVFALQLAYFSNLRADVITSCCGSLFSVDAQSVAGELAGLPPGPALAGFYLVLLATLAAHAHHLRTRRGAALAGLFSALAFVVGIAGIVSFLALYIYEHPHHHCPFCLLQAEHGYIGYLLYPPLFAAAVSGTGVGVLAPFRHRPGLRPVLPALMARLSRLALAGFVLFLALTSVLIARSGLKLLGA